MWCHPVRSLGGAHGCWTFCNPHCHHACLTRCGSRPCQRLARRFVQRRRGEWHPHHHGDSRCGAFRACVDSRQATARRLAVCQHAHFRHHTRCLHQRAQPRGALSRHHLHRGPRHRQRRLLDHHAQRPAGVRGVCLPRPTLSLVVPLSSSSTERRCHASF
jgi:hypothetical protein